METSGSDLPMIVDVVLHTKRQPPLGIFPILLDFCIKQHCGYFGVSSLSSSSPSSYILICNLISHFLEHPCTADTDLVKHTLVL